MPILMRAADIKANFFFKGNLRNVEREYFFEHFECIQLCLG